MSERYGIAEWYGEPLETMPLERRQALAKVALGEDPAVPRCPFQRGNVVCSKKGGVCSLQTYRAYLVGGHLSDRIGQRAGNPVITCPKRFSQDDLVPKWLAEIVGFQEVFLAREVPFMRSPETGRETGRIDLVLAGSSTASRRFGLEIPAVYFSGRGMPEDFVVLRWDTGRLPPRPTAVRRPDCANPSGSD